MPEPEPLDRSPADLAAELLADPFVAHTVLFPHRHPDPSPDFHRLLIGLYHSHHKDVVALTFRGSAKSTLLEELAVILAASGQVSSVLIVGESWQRAVERLRSIKREFESNTYLIYIFGEQVGPQWSESRIELKNGCTLTALGQGQALRGIKHNTSRPDLCLVDDLESDDSVATPEAREKLSDWFWADLIPALSPDRRLIMTATPLHPLSLAVALSEMAHVRAFRIPVEMTADSGIRKSLWPERFPLTRQHADEMRTHTGTQRMSIDELKEAYASAGKMHKWSAEMMVQAVDPATRLFRAEDFICDPNRRHTWEPVYIAIDPARTTRASSATTGCVAASYIGRKLVVFEARGERWQPSEIIDRIFALEERYHPVAIGVERDGLEEFILAPIREEMIKRGKLLPLQPLRAPKGKLDFISRLQPLFAAHDIVLAGAREEFTELIKQFLSFPTGFIDIPNALAYVLEMRGGEPVYGDAAERHLSDLNMPLLGGLATLCLNAGPFGCAAVLFRYTARVLMVVRDWVASGPPGECIASMVEEARLCVANTLKVTCPPIHFDTRNDYGLLGALKGVAQVNRGGDGLKGREVIRELLRSEVRGGPRLILCPDAIWTRRALYGGFVWGEGRTRPRSSIHVTLVEALESACAALARPQLTSQKVAFTPDGTPYYSAAARPLDRLRG